jgi:hypothetical protein
MDTDLGSDTGIRMQRRSHAEASNVSARDGGTARCRRTGLSRSHHDYRRLPRAGDRDRIDRCGHPKVLAGCGRRRCRAETRGHGGEPRGRRGAAGRAAASARHCRKPRHTAATTASPGGPPSCRASRARHVTVAIEAFSRHPWPECGGAYQRSPARPHARRRQAETVTDRRCTMDDAISATGAQRGHQRAGSRSLPSRHAVNATLGARGVRLRTRPRVHQSRRVLAGRLRSTPAFLAAP